MATSFLVGELDIPAAFPELVVAEVRVLVKGGVFAIHRRWGSTGGTASITIKS